MLEKRYNEYESYKLLMKNNKINFEDFFTKAKSTNEYNKAVEKFNDAVHRTIIENKAFKLLKSVISKKYNYLINDRTRDLFRTVVLENISRKELQDNITKKIARYENSDDFNSDIVEYINKKINWGKENILNKIKDEELDVDIIENNKNEIFIKINNKNAAKRLGSQTWCITQDGNMYEHYTKDINSFYFRYDFNLDADDNGSLIALIGNNKSGKIIDAYLKNDDNIEEIEQFKKYEEKTYKMKDAELKQYIEKIEKKFYKNLLQESNPFALFEEEYCYSFKEKIKEAFSYIEDNDLDDENVHFNNIIKHIYKSKGKANSFNSNKKEDIESLLSETIFFTFKEFFNEKKESSFKSIELIENNENIKELMDYHNIKLKDVILNTIKNDEELTCVDIYNYYEKKGLISIKDILKELKENNPLSALTILALTDNKESLNKNKLSYIEKNINDILMRVMDHSLYNNSDKSSDSLLSLYEKYSTSENIRKNIANSMVVFEFKTNVNVLSEIKVSDVNSNCLFDDLKEILSNNNFITINKVNQLLSDEKINSTNNLLKKELLEIDLLNTFDFKKEIKSIGFEKIFEQMMDKNKRQKEKDIELIDYYKDETNSSIKSFSPYVKEVLLKNFDQNKFLNKFKNKKELTQQECLNYSFVNSLMLNNKNIEFVKLLENVKKNHIKKEKKPNNVMQKKTL